MRARRGAGRRPPGRSAPPPSPYCTGPAESAGGCGVGTHLVGPVGDVRLHRPHRARPGAREPWPRGGRPKIRRASDSIVGASAAGPPVAVPPDGRWGRRRPPARRLLPLARARASGGAFARSSGSGCSCSGGGATAAAAACPAGAAAVGAAVAAPAWGEAGAAAGADRPSPPAALGSARRSGSVRLRRPGGTAAAPARSPPAWTTALAASELQDGCGFLGWRAGEKVATRNSLGGGRVSREAELPPD